MAEWEPPGGFSPRVLAVDQHAFRATGTDVEATELAAGGRGSRYDRVGEPQSFYATLHRHVAVIEIERRTGVPLARIRLTAVRIKGSLLDAFGPEGLAALGLRRIDLIRRDNSTCLKVADLARSAGCSGLLVPSAVLEEHANVVIWHEAVPKVVRVLNERILALRYPSRGKSKDAGA
jgi:RES domain-containing protein